MNRTKNNFFQMSNFQKKITKLILTQLGITQIWKFMAATPIHFA